MQFINIVVRSSNKSGKRIIKEVCRVTPCKFKNKDSFHIRFFSGKTRHIYLNDVIGFEI